MTHPVKSRLPTMPTTWYLRLSFKAPAGGFDKSDKDNELKATVLFPNGQIPMPEQVGCWATRHQDLKTMKEGSDKTKKYVASGACRPDAMGEQRQNGGWQHYRQAGDGRWQGRRQGGRYQGRRHLDGDLHRKLAGGLRLAAAGKPGALKLASRSTPTMPVGVFPMPLAWTPRPRC